MRQHTHLHRDTNQRPGLMDVDVLQLHQIERGALGLQIHRLTADHAARPTGAGERRHHSHARLGAQPRRLGQGLEGQRLERVAGQDRRRLVEGAMTGRTPATQVVVVHRRQIVVDQRIGVDHLDGAGRAVEQGGLESERLAGGIGEQRTDTLAAGQHRVAHGLVQARRLHAHGRQDLVERGLDARTTARAEVIQGVISHGRRMALARRPAGRR